VDFKNREVKFENEKEKIFDNQIQIFDNRLTSLHRAVMLRMKCIVACASQGISWYVDN